VDPQHVLKEGGHQWVRVFTMPEAVRRVPGSSGPVIASRIGLLVENEEADRGEISSLAARIATATSPAPGVPRSRGYLNSLRRKRYRSRPHVSRVSTVTAAFVNCPFSDQALSGVSPFGLKHHRSPSTRAPYSLRIRSPGPFVHTARGPPLISSIDRHGVRITRPLSKYSRARAGN